MNVRDRWTGRWRSEPFQLLLNIFSLTEYFTELIIFRDKQQSHSQFKRLFKCDSSSSPCQWPAMLSNDFIVKLQANMTKKVTKQLRTIKIGSLWVLIEFANGKKNLAWNFSQELLVESSKKANALHHVNVIKNARKSLRFENTEKSIKLILQTRFSDLERECYVTQQVRDARNKFTLLLH